MRYVDRAVRQFWSAQWRVVTLDTWKYCSTWPLFTAM